MNSFQPKRASGRLSWAHLLIALGVFYVVSRHLLSLSPSRVSSLGLSTFHHPVAVPHTQPKVVAVVFYGRPANVEILDCYLQQNLKANGGLVDEVLFLVHTKWQRDVAWLDELVAQRPYYSRSEEIQPHGYNYYDVWTHITEPDTIYVKIDDDVLWMDTNAIPRLVQKLQEHPESYAVTSNIINSPITQWFHFRTGALHPFLPESADSSLERQDPAGDINWRPSSLPMFEGHHENYWNNTREPAFKGSRLLPLEDGYASMELTPIEALPYGQGTASWWSWAAGAQQHYSLLRNIEQDTLNLYHFGNNEGLWDLHYEHYNLNFYALWGRDVNLTGLKHWGGDDERSFTINFPKAAQRPVLLDTKSLIAHFSYGRQRDGMAMTDVLARYRGLAQETVCQGQLKGLEFDYATYGVDVEKQDKIQAEKERKYREDEKKKHAAAEAAKKEAAAEEEATKQAQKAKEAALKKQEAQADKKDEEAAKEEAEVAEGDALPETQGESEADTPDKTDEDSATTSSHERQS